MATELLQEIVCCMGQPVAGNPTQYMMEKAMKAARLDWRYLTFEVPPERLELAVAGMKAMGFKGANFTIPHKVKVIEYLDRLSEAAEMMGAVNCVNRDDDGLYVGENTDGKGFVESLRAVTDPADKRVVVLGAGGAARAIAVELALANIAHLTVVNRTAARGKELADLVGEKTDTEVDAVPWGGDYYVPEGTDVLINATSIGLNDSTARVPIATDTLRPAMIVADVVFNPPKTCFLLEAAKQGCTTLDGLGMLVNQAVIGFRLWTGVDPNAAVMREALEEYLEL